MNIQIKRLDNCVKLPIYATDGSVGLDLFAAIEKPITVSREYASIIPTGVAIAIPPGYEGQIRSRSGLAIKFGVVVINSPGTIDSDFRGEIVVGLCQVAGNTQWRVNPGDKIAQMVITPVVKAELMEVQELGETCRGAGGLGSTGR